MGMYVQSCVAVAAATAAGEVVVVEDEKGGKGNVMEAGRLRKGRSLPTARSKGGNESKSFSGSQPNHHCDS